MLSISEEELGELTALKSTLDELLARAGVAAGAEGDIARMMAKGCGGTCKGCDGCDGGKVSLMASLQDFELAAEHLDTLGPHAFTQDRLSKLDTSKTGGAPPADIEGQV